MIGSLSWYTAKWGTDLSNSKRTVASCWAESKKPGNELNGVEVLGECSACRWRESTSSPCGEHSNIEEVGRHWAGAMPGQTERETRMFHAFGTGKEETHKNYNKKIQISILNIKTYHTPDNEATEVMTQRRRNNDNTWEWPTNGQTMVDSGATLTHVLVTYPS